MKFRFTIKQLKEMTDEEILRGLTAERKSDLNPYAPLASKLNAIYKKLDNKIIMSSTQKRALLASELHYIYVVESKQGCHGVFVNEDSAKIFCDKLDGRIARRPRVETYTLRTYSGYSSTNEDTRDIKI